MGQTRLALRFAADHADAYAAHDGGGAWFSRPLGGAYRRRHASAVASALGVSLAVRDGDAAMAEHVGRALRGRGRLLLVLDDFERLVDAAPGTVVPWLRAVARAASLRVREIRDRLARSGALACADADASLRAEAHLSRGIARPCASRSRSRAVDADMLGP